MLLHIHGNIDIDSASITNVNLANHAGSLESASCCAGWSIHRSSADDLGFSQTALFESGQKYSFLTCFKEILQQKRSSALSLRQIRSSYLPFSPRRIFASWNMRRTTRWEPCRRMWWTFLSLTRQKERPQSLALIRGLPWPTFQACASTWIQSSPWSAQAMSLNQFYIRFYSILLPSSIIPIGHIGMRVLVGCLYLIDTPTVFKCESSIALLILLQTLGMGTLCPRVARLPSSISKH